MGKVTRAQNYPSVLNCLISTGFKMGTLSSDNHLLAEPVPSSGCAKGCSKSAATSVFSGKIHPDSTGGL